MIKASVYGNTDTGRIRSNNEDAYIAQRIWDDKHWLLVVIDGLGGHEGGEVAAYIARSVILKVVKKNQSEECLDVIMQAVTEANNSIYKERDSKEELFEMGCVITAAILDLGKKRLSVAHVGDTRLYQYDNGALLKLTHDHSFVGNLEDEGRITEVEAMTHPRRNYIDRIVGDALKDTDTPKFIEASIFPVTKGTQFLLCSDGLSDMLTSFEISSVLQSKSNVKRKVDHLISSANEHGGKDNVTVVLASIVLVQEKKNLVGRKSSSKEQKQKSTFRPKRSAKINRKRFQKNNHVSNDFSRKLSNSFVELVVLIMVLSITLFYIIIYIL